jgi:hypothetical protein
MDLWSRVLTLWFDLEDARRCGALVIMWRVRRTRSLAHAMASRRERGTTRSAAVGCHALKDLSRGEDLPWMQQAGSSLSTLTLTPPNAARERFSEIRSSTCTVGQKNELLLCAPQARHYIRRRRRARPARPETFLGFRGVLILETTLEFLSFTISTDPTATSAPPYHLETASRPHPLLGGG